MKISSVENLTSLRIIYAIALDPIWWFANYVRGHVTRLSLGLAFWNLTRNLDGKKLRAKTLPRAVTELDSATDLKKCVFSRLPKWLIKISVRSVSFENMLGIFQHEICLFRVFESPGGNKFIPGRCISQLLCSEHHCWVTQEARRRAFSSKSRIYAQDLNVNPEPAQELSRTYFSTQSACALHLPTLQINESRIIIWSLSIFIQRQNNKNTSVPKTGKRKSDG